MNHTKPQCYRPKELAAALGISERTLRDWDKRRLIASHKLGGVTIYLVQDVLEFLSSNRREAIGREINSEARPNSAWQKIQELIAAEVDRAIEERLGLRTQEEAAGMNRILDRDEIAKLLV